MPEFEFDVDASIAAGWERFASRLAGFLRDLVPGATFDLTVPVPGVRPDSTPYIRFTAAETSDHNVTGSRGGQTGDPHTPASASASASASARASHASGDGASSGAIDAVVSGGGSDDDQVPLRPLQYEQLTGLGWDVPRDVDSTELPRLTMPTYEASHLAHLVAGTIERVFGIPHPVFLHDVADATVGMRHSEPPRVAAGTSMPVAPVADAADFRSEPINDPDQATRAVGVALSEVYGDQVESDEHDLFTVPAGSVVLFIRAHRSLPLIVFRSPLVPAVEDAGAAETEVAILNRDSLWCRYVFDGKSVYAESEFVDRVFVPVNFKIQLTEISAELDDVYPDLARRVAPKQWRDLHSADDPRPGDQ